MCVYIYIYYPHICIHTYTHTHTQEKTLFKHPVYKALWMPMIDTADIVATRYKISRERQDQHALESQKRTFEAQKAGRYDAEIVPLNPKP